MPAKCVFNKLWIEKEKYQEWLLVDDDRYKAKCGICTKAIGFTVGRNNKMLQNIGSRLRVVLCDCRTFIGTLAAYDKHMNLVLKNTIEYKKYVPKKCKEEIEEKRTLGFIILRGENIVSMIVEKSTDSSRSSSPSSASGSSSRY